MGVAYPEKKEEEEDGNLVWKVPIWQKPINVATLAPHPDGPLENQKREGYLQKRAGTSRLRWNIRFFELSNGYLKWWRPQFREMLKMPTIPKDLRQDPRPRPIRSLDLRKLKAVVRTRVKFPYSTRILLIFREDYTKYQLELRAERENIILEWFRIFDRFAVEGSYERELDAAEEREDSVDTTATPGSQSDGEEEGFEDVAPGSEDCEVPPEGVIVEECRGPLAKAKAKQGAASSSSSGGYAAS